MYIARRDGTRPLGISLRAGMRLPAPHTATGKAMLSSMGDDQVRALFDGAWPPPTTPASVADLDALLVELAETRARGFSINHGHSRDGASCFGAAVLGLGGGAAVAGVAVALLTAAVNDQAIETAGGAVRQVAGRLSRRLGAAPRHGGMV